LSRKSIFKKVVRILKYQLKEIAHKASWTLLSRKILKGLLWVAVAFGAVFITPFVLFIRLISPIIALRFSYFSIHRIGHLAFDVEYYLASQLCERKEGKRKTLDLFFLVGKPCNKFLLSLIRRRLSISPLVRIPYYSNKLIPRAYRHTLLPSWETNGSRDHKGYLASTQPQLALSNNEKSKGIEMISQTGWTPEQPIVCLIVRDSAYLKTLIADKDWGYHSYRDTDIANYRLAAVALAEKGYWVFRMGKAVEQEFIANHPQVIDYATSTWRDDFLDIWLMANCEFCISTSTGFDSLAAAFRKPLALVNFMPLAEFQTWSSCVLAPSHLIWEKNGRKLSCREHLEHCYLRLDEYVNTGINVQELSSSEIWGVVNELELRLSKKWVVSDKASASQQRFWEIYKSGGGWTPPDAYFHPEARLSSEFLELNPEFLS